MYELRRNKKEEGGTGKKRKYCDGRATDVL
jgi:hypothetical protein